MRQKLRIQLSKLKVITVAWMIIAVIFALLDHLLIFSSYSSGGSEAYGFLNNLIFNILATVIAVGLGGTFLVFYINERFRERPYIYGILMVVGTYITVVSLITLVLGLVFVPMNTGLPISDPVSRKAYVDYLLDSLHLKNIISWSVVVGTTQLLLQINDKFGHGVLWDLVKGKYHSPREEKRIFMFLDLKSSTTIAERLGNKKYYHLLKDFYADITNAILYNKGEIYQYVGDEVVVSWKFENGIENYHCLRCYFEMRESIASLREKYLDRYGLVPDFKAGIHCGIVTAGEIGIIKRDITFSGDVLNTASRIQTKCNEYGVSVLASDELLTQMPNNGLFDSKAIGAIELRGKEKKVQLSTVSVSSSQ